MTDHTISHPPMRQSRRDAGEVENEFDMIWFFKVLWAGKLWIVAGIVLGIVAAYVYTAVAQSIYSADGLVQVRQSDSSGLSGITSPSGGGFGGVASLLGVGGSTAQSEIPIVTSRSVLGKTVRDLNLATVVTGSGGGLFGSPPAIPYLKRFDIPDDLRGAAFTLRLTQPGQYTLVGPSSETIATGPIGQALHGKTRDGQSVSVLLDAQHGLKYPSHFTVVKGAWLSAIGALNHDLTVDVATAGSNVLKLTYLSPNRNLVAPVLNSVIGNYVGQNVDATTRDAGKSLGFLKKQLPQLNKQLKHAEARLADYQEKHQPVPLDSQGQALLSQSSNLAGIRAQLEQRIAELKQMYTANYPAVKAAEQQLRQLGSQDTQLSQKINTLPGREKQLLGLQRDVEVKTQLYTALLNREQQLRVVQAGASGNIRVVDTAADPVGRSYPRSKIVMLICVLLGLMIAVAFILIREALRPGVRDHELIERHTGLDVFAVVPGVLFRRGVRRSARDASSVLSGDESMFAPTADSLRRLRTRIHLIRQEQDINTLVLTAPTNEVGRGFITTNLAYLFGRIGERAVVVDANMQNGTTGSNRLSAGQPPRGPGLSEYLNGKATFEDILGTLGDTDVAYISSGSKVKDSSDLLMRAQFVELIETLRQRFDWVLVNAPAVNAASDGAVVPSVVTGALTLMIVGYDRHSMAEIDNAREQLARQHCRVDGVVFTTEFDRRSVGSRLVRAS